MSLEFSEQHWLGWCCTKIGVCGSIAGLIGASWQPRRPAASYWRRLLTTNCCPPVCIAGRGCHNLGAALCTCICWAIWVSPRPAAWAYLHLFGWHPVPQVPRLHHTAWYKWCYELHVLYIAWPFLAVGNLGWSHLWEVQWENSCNKETFKVWELAWRDNRHWCHSLHLEILPSKHAGWVLSLYLIRDLVPSFQIQHPF